MRGKNKIKVGVDLLGSDMRPSDLLEAVLIFSKELKPSVHLILFGMPVHFGRRRPPNNVTFYPVKEAIEMDDAPLAAIRKKRNSSICLGIKQLKEGELNAFISAGNTGALMGCAKLTLPALAKVERPALLTLLPTRKNEIAVLDVGANTTYKAKHLVQFAAMGVAYQRSRGVKVPKVGLLNIGSEAKKGTPELQEAYHLLQKKSPSHTFVGNIEGRDVFQGEIDVLVTDGFTGNVFLKTAEGIASVILEEIETSIYNKGVLAEMRSRLHYAEYPGALLCGVDGIVIKCHGNASPQSLTRSIVTAHRLIEHSFLERVADELKN